MASIQVGQRCVFFRPQDKVRLEEVGLPNIESGRSVIGVKCFSLTCPDSVWNLACDNRFYGGKGALEIFVQERSRCRRDRSMVKAESA